MEQKISSFQNRGMVRDTSISKINNEFAYENFNIRITTRGENSLLSIINEIGNSKINIVDEINIENLFIIQGTLIGYTVLNEWLILFTTNDKGNDFIYRICYKNNKFSGRILYSGNLNFSSEYPIESIVYYESEDIQKVYWVDGKNQPRFINIMNTELNNGNTKSSYFDFVSTFIFSAECSISKSYSGIGNFPSGVIQYAFTYSNMYGQESNIFNVSSLYYLSNSDRGASPEEIVNCQFDIKLTKLDGNFDRVNIYSIIRTSLNGTPQVNKVASINIKYDKDNRDYIASYNDNNTYKINIDPTILLYIGGREIIAGTLTQKDNTLFLGDLKLNSLKVIPAIKEAADKLAFSEDKSHIVFISTSDSDNKYSEYAIPYEFPSGEYSYKIQLDNNSTHIKTFKGGETYRFGVRFKTSIGEYSSTYFLGDKTNTIYPDIQGNIINRAIAVITLSQELIQAAINAGYNSAQPVIAEASYNDRTVLAQGFVCPTLFNLKQRCDNSPFTISSWFTRIEGLNSSLNQYTALKDNKSYAAEIQCMQNVEISPWYYEGNNTDSDNIAVERRVMAFWWRTLQDNRTGVAYIDYSAKGDIVNTGVFYNLQYLQYVPRTGNQTDAVQNRRACAEAVYNKLLELGAKLDTNTFFETYDNNFIISINSNLTYRIFPTYPFDSYGDNKISTPNANIKNWKYDTDVINFMKARKDRCLYIPLNVLGNSINKFVESNKNNYYIDKSIVTFHTPELTNTTSTIFGALNNVKFRIVGLAKITANTSQNRLTVTNGLNPGNASQDPYLGSINPYYGEKNYFSWPYYLDDFIQNDSEQRTGMFFIYPWHKEGSITCQEDSNTKDKLAEIKTHVTAKRWFASNTVYRKMQLSIGLNKFWEPINGIGTPKIYNYDTPTLLQIDTIFGSRTYQGTYDYLLSMNKSTADNGIDNGYEIYYLKDTGSAPSVADKDTLNSMSSLESDSNNKFYDPVRIKFKSTPHIVIPFNGNKINKEIESLPIIGKKLFNFPMLNSSKKGTLPWAVEEAIEPEGRSYTLIYDPSRDSHTYSSNRVKITDNIKVLGNINDEKLLQFVNGDRVILTYDSNSHLKSYLGNKFERSNEMSYPSPYKVRSIVTNDDILDYSSGIISTSLNFTITCKSVKNTSNNVYPTVIGKLYKRIEDSETLIDTITLEKIETLNEEEKDISFKGIKEVSDITGTSNIEYYWRLECDLDTINDSSYNSVLDITSAVANLTPAICVDNFSEESKLTAKEFNDSANDGDTFYIVYGILEELDDSYYNLTSGDTSIKLDKATLVNKDLLVGNEYALRGNCKIIDNNKTLINAENNVYTITDSILVNDSETEVKPLGDSTEERWYIISDNVNEIKETCVLIDFNNSNIRYQFTYKLNNSTETLITLSEWSLKDPDYLNQTDGESTVFIGELYQEVNNRFGGTSEFAIQNNVFIPAGNDISLLGSETIELLATEGDTFFQRWDCVKTLPYSEEDTNSVIDICSFMVETHQNIDGRYDKRRYNSDIVNTDNTNFNLFNEVYSQNNNFFTSNVLSDKYTLDKFPSQITWTKTKIPTEEIDTWTNITLASTMDLDGDKGPVRAIRRFNNSIIAFQDKGISEILFNSRTQLSTEQGIPIEIANSGKVDGKRYLSDKEGCVNKWSILETSNGIYFIDDINSSLNLFNGRIQSLSTIKGFRDWIAEHNSMNIWNPKTFLNTVTYWDRANDDVYFINKSNRDTPNVLCYNEHIQEFTSFFKYGNVPMMVNLQDKFIAFRDNNLWLQGEGKYCNLFGEDQDYYIEYRITPDPYSDKVFTNIDYRADIFDLNQSSNIQGKDYLTEETFNTIHVWNEYQDTGEVIITDKYPSVRRKFRIWRMDIPRDKKDSPDNRFGLNRIRNPWIHLRLTKLKELNSNKRIEFHDLAVRYI